MPTVESTQARLMNERARALAILLLTRRPEVQIREVGDDVGLDMVVRLTSERKQGLRQFGVGLRSMLEPVSAGHANRTIRPMLRSHAAYGPFPFPAVFFLFTMRDDQGWYTWIAEPVIAADGRVQLPLRDEPDCQPLDAESMDRIIDRIDRWYDAHFDELSADLPEGRRE